MRVRRLVRACADTVCDRMRRLAGVAGGCMTVADQDVELGQARARAAVVDAHRRRRRAARRAARRSGARASPGTDVLRVVAPVAVGADPDLEQRRLVLEHRSVAGRGEGADPRARPDEREAERELDLSVPAGPLAVDEALPTAAASLSFIPAGRSSGRRAPSPPRRSRSPAASARAPAPS